jgi:hypothetical protein
VFVSLFEPAGKAVSLPPGYLAMSRLLSAPSRRLTALAGATLALVACVLAVQAHPAGAATPNEARFVPFIVGGQEASISQFPWQVFVLLKAEGTGAACGGSILNATTILTAAHCVDHEGTTITYPAADFVVAAGDSNVDAEVIPPLLQPPAQHQRRRGRAHAQ